MNLECSHQRSCHKIRVAIFRNTFWALRSSHLSPDQKNDIGYDADDPEC